MPAAASHNAQAHNAHRPTIAVTRHAISAGHYLATTAGFDILQAGGNAVDAGVAAGIALGVLQSDLVDVAGVAPIMIYLADKREVVTIAGLGYLAEGARPRTVHAATTAARSRPACCARSCRRRRMRGSPRLRRYGTMSFGDVAAAAAAAGARRLSDVPADGGQPEKERRAARRNGRRVRRCFCPGASRRKPATCSARPISAPRCNT